jgi:hypothetical protein
MAFLLLPSKHWLIALVPLSVACAALIWKGQETSPGNSPGKPASVAPVKEQTLPAPAKEISQQDIPTPVNSHKKKLRNGNLEGTMKILEKELTRRESQFRKMQEQIYFSLKKMELKKNQSSNLHGMQHGLENIDLNENKMISEADSLLDLREKDLKKSLEKAAKNIQEVKIQLRSYQEMLNEMREMAYRKNGRFNIDID